MRLPFDAKTARASGDAEVQCKRRPMAGDQRHRAAGRGPPGSVENLVMKNVTGKSAGGVLRQSRHQPRRRIVGNTRERPKAREQNRA